VPDDVWIVANFKETQLARIKPGQPVSISIDAWPGRTFTGRIDSIQSGTGSRFSMLPAENATGNFVKVVQRVPVKITLEPGQANDHDHPLAPGMSAEPEVDVR
jgi:membrane fusion protein (multidrug efflux system)